MATHSGVLNLLPYHCIRDRMLLKGLIRFGSTDKSDFQKAFGQIPYNTRMMYVNAYQAFLWNTAACYRLVLESHKLLVGDLIEINGQVREVPQTCHNLTRTCHNLPGIFAPTVDCRRSIGSVPGPPQLRSTSCWV